MSSDPFTTVGTADRNWLEALLVEFDQRWGPDRLAEAVARLPAAGRVRTAGLRELVRIDMERHARRGQPVSPDNYFARYPELLETGITPLGPNESTPSVSPAGRPALPEQFGRYRIVRPLGRGGMGSVFLARDTELDRLVALKVPHFRADDPDAAERFAREARAAATIDHPNVCRVYDVGRIDGTPFLTMTYIEGRTLADQVRAAQLEPRRAVEVVRDAARGMAAAHSHGVVHRDLKPGNILMAPNGRPVVTDFGLARRAADDVRLTSSGVVMGTPLYMSPEQVVGDTDRVGPASDVYALGVVLYELLAGRPPFGMDRADVMAGTLSKDPLPPSALRPGLDPRFDDVVLRAMAKRPEDRPSMAQFADALDTPASHAGARPPRRPLHRTLIGTAVAAIALGLFLPAAVKLGWFGPGGGDSNTPRIDDDKKGDDGGRGGAKTDEKSGQSGDAKVEQKEPPAPKPLGTGTLADAKDRLSAVGFSPDGQELYTAVVIGTVQVAIHRWDIATGKDVSGKVQPDLGMWAAFAPGGRRFVLGAGGQYTEIVSITTGKTGRRFNTGPHGHSAAVTRDGKWIIVGYEELSGKYHWARVWEIDAGRKAGEYNGHKEDIRAVAISDDGRWAYSASEDREVLMEVGATKPAFMSTEHSVECAASIPNSDRFLVGSRFGAISVRSAATSDQPKPFAERHDERVTCLAVSPDGRLAVSGSADHTVWVWDVATGRRVWKLTEHTGPVTGVAFSHDGRRLASCAADRTWRVWELPGMP
jgi:predicted Ser/Thr protein kinase